MHAKAAFYIEEYNEDDIVGDADNEIVVERYTSAVQVVLGNERRCGALDVGRDAPNLHIERVSDHWQIFVHGHDGDAAFTLRMYDKGRVTVELADNGKTIGDSDEL